jgi:hypothetical protein
MRTSIRSLLGKFCGHEEDGKPTEADLHKPYSISFPSILPVYSLLPLKV